MKDTPIQTIVLMAGDATRFEGSKYSDPKPFIKVKGKSIVEWTISSLSGHNLSLVFATRKKHNARNFLDDKFGQSSKMVEFDRLTRGNLETALLAFQQSGFAKSDPLLILDADNLYDGKMLSSFLREKHSKYGEFACVCYFDKIDNSSKWCFAHMQKDSHAVIELIEKDPRALKLNAYPMVGVFYYSSGSLFEKLATKVMADGSSVKNEFYMSQSITRAIQDKIPVFGLKVPNVVPLGEPQDVERFENASS